MNIKLQFEKLSTKEIVQLYSIVIIIYAIVYVLYPSTITPDTQSNIIKTNLQKKIKYTSDLEFLTYFTQVSKKYTISIDEVRILDNSIEIKTKEKYHNIMVFLSIVNKSFHINSFVIKKEKNTIVFFMSLDKKNHTSNLLSLQKKLDIPKDIENPFMQNKMKPFVKIPTIRLSTIIKNEVLIDNSWYKIGDKVYGYTIDSISRMENKVVFVHLKTNEKLTKRIDDE